MTTAQAEEIVNHPLEASAAWRSDFASSVNSGPQSCSFSSLSFGKDRYAKNLLG